MLLGKAEKLRERMDQTQQRAEEEKKKKSEMLMTIQEREELENQEIELMRKKKLQRKAIQEAERGRAVVEATLQVWFQVRAHTRRI